MKTTEFPTTHAQTEFFQSEVGQQALQLISHEGLRLVVEKFSTYKIPVEVDQAFGWELPDHEIRLVTRIFEAWLEAKEAPVVEDYSPVGRARKLLGVAAGATKTEIKAAWKRAAVANHPDLGGNTQVMQQINAAYELLK
jgi:hypothetical protein